MMNRLYHKIFHHFIYTHGLIEWEDSGHQQEFTEVRCSCGKEWT